MRSKPFDVYGWDYKKAKTCILELVETLKLTIGRRNLWLQQVLEQCGGKTFGLNICELIAELDPGFRVPPYQFFNRKKVSGLLADTDHGLNELFCWSGRYMEDVSVRSSSEQEDWVDPRSGVEDSIWVSKKHAAETVRHFLKELRQVLIQELAIGVGCVADIGFSRLYSAPIIRFAHGNVKDNDNKEDFSSAVWDLNSSAGIYGIDGSPILPLENTVMDKSASDFAIRITDTLEWLGIDFGIQFELVIHPEAPGKFNLVQIRPSPGSIRGLKNLPRRFMGKLVGTTPYVNKAGYALGQVFAIQCPEISKEAWAEAKRIRDPAKIPKFLGVSPSDFRNKIILWQNLKAIGVLALDFVYTASICGAIGQISRDCLYANFHHTYHRPVMEVSRKRLEIAQASGILVKADGETEKKVLELSGKKTRICIVSDGLVGQIYAS